MNVLCAVDGSKHSRWALDSLRRLSLASGGKVLLVHVVDIARFGPSKAMGAEARSAMAGALASAEQTGRQLLERMKKRVETANGAAAVKLVRGHPAEALARIAARYKTDLILIGSRGATDIRRFLLGSVSRRVVMHAPCPVLVVKKSVPALRRIVVGVDGSKQGQAAIEFLLRLPIPEDARVTVVSVVPPLPIESSLQPPPLLNRVLVPLEKQARDVAAQEAARIRRAGFEATGLAVHGNPGHEIVRLAESERADLVVVGSRGLTGSTRFLMGSVSDGVVKYVPCPVLVVRR
jgi:nucleotide-binding universal stress UspA family protein